MHIEKSALEMIKENKCSPPKHLKYLISFVRNAKCHMLSQKCKGFNLLEWKCRQCSIKGKTLILIQCKLYRWAECTVGWTSQSRGPRRLLMLQLASHCCKVEGFKQNTCLSWCPLYAMVCAHIFPAQWQQQWWNLELDAKKRDRKDEGKQKVLSN